MERFRDVGEVFLSGPGRGQPERFEVESAWEHKGRVILKFRGVDTIAAAELLRGNEVRIPVERRRPLEAGEYFQSDLIGCEVVERATGRTIGKVTGWQDNGSQALLEVAGTEGREILVPFAASICVEIDVAAGRIGVDMPEGLKDLNG
jgi:16S rRNA processing protein RimM